MFTDIMIDLETTGTDPEHCAIIQIAAVKFNLLTGEVGTDTFDRAMTFAPNRFWQEGGRDFWMKMPEIYKEIMGRAADPLHVMGDFDDWVKKDVPEEGWRMWAKPITFEWAFISSYYRQFDAPMPFHYRFARDLNSYIAGLRGTPEHYALEEEIPFEGKEHNALWDCFHQIKVLLHAQQKYGPINAV